MIRILYFDYVIKKLQNIALGYYCYDRVAQNFTLISDQAFDMPLSAIIFYLK